MLEAHVRWIGSLRGPKVGRQPALKSRVTKQPSPPTGAIDPRIAAETREQTSHSYAPGRATAESADTAAARDPHNRARGSSLLPWSVPPKQEPPLCTEDAGRETCVPVRDPPNALLA